MNNINVSIVTIGDEILIGQITDSNSAWLADKLYHFGFSVSEIRSISDEPPQIKQTIEDLLAHSQLIVLTGGLGPTNDDRTKAALNDFFGGTMQMNEAVLDDIKKFIIKKRGYLQLSENNRAQALVSNKCTVLRNPAGTAPVQVFTHHKAIVISMPGVPFEMKHLFDNVVMPYLKKQFQLKPNAYQTFHVVGYPESELANTLNEWENNLPVSMSLAYLPSPGVIRLRLTEQNNDKTILNTQTKKLRKILQNSIVAEGNEKVEFTLGKILNENQQKIAVAESCTGGLIAHRIASVPDASAYFCGGITAYSNEAKNSLLKVKASTIEQHGAVSEATAKEMAYGAAQAFQTPLAISTTGIAGPTGGTAKKPVGTVWIGIYINGEVYAQHFLFTHDRMVNIERTSTVAMYELIRKIM